MDPLEDTAMEFIDGEDLFAGADQIVLAVSGGADSTALLHILAKLTSCGLITAELICAHINHQLRGPASDGDEQFVIEQAKKLKLPVVSKAVDVRAYAHTHRLSVETAGRHVRMAALGDIARAHNGAWIATGHQKNDNAETVVQRLLRGTGLRGLAGIRPARRFAGGLWFARPLLCVTRNNILAYLDRHSLRWREDHTNADLTYTRNYIRHKLLPTLQHESGGSLVEKLSALAASAARLNDRVRHEAKEARASLVAHSEDTIAISASGLALLPEPVAVELVRQMLVQLGSGERDLRQSHYRGLLDLARPHMRGKMLALPGRFTARREGDDVLLQANPSGLAPLPPATEADRCDEIQPITLPVPGSVRFAGYTIETHILTREQLEHGKIKSDKSPFQEYLDLDRVRGPVVVRTRRAGDRFTPLGLADDKKVGKFLTAAKVPRDVRKRVLVFADDRKILWVCPVRISERAKIREETQRVLVLKVSRTTLQKEQGDQR